MNCGIAHFFYASLSSLHYFILLCAKPYCPGHCQDQAAGEDFPADGSKPVSASTQNTFSLLFFLRTIAAHPSLGISSFLPCTSAVWCGPSFLDEFLITKIVVNKNQMFCLRPINRNGAPVVWWFSGWARSLDTCALWVAWVLSLLWITSSWCSHLCPHFLDKTSTSPCFYLNLILLAKPLYGCSFMHALGCSGFSGHSHEARKSSTFVSFDIYPHWSAWHPAGFTPRLVYWYGLCTGITSLTGKVEQHPGWHTKCQFMEVLQKGTGD